MIHHIFSDMDGTLLNSQGKLAASNATLIKQAQIPVTLVSARAPIEMAPAITGLGLTGAQIAFNGGLIFTPGSSEALVEFPLEADVANRLLTFIQQEFPAVSLSYYDRTRWYTSRIDDGIRYEESLTELAPKLVVADIQGSRQLTVFKLMMITFDLPEMVALDHALRELDLPGIAIQRSGDAYLEITSKQAQKSTGIRFILDRLGLTTDATAAFGDGHNDLPMLRLVGTPIAMANAQPDVLQICRYTTASNDEDGVGVGIHRFLKD